ncbi:MAG TPA: hypothetical protein PKL22_10415 [Saprospiraceae bacterium]|nr:hypothetical protein [Saprospiraceae bacterium]
MGDSREITKIFLHIGMPKTGSSALQQFFFLNRLHLLSKGLYYPLTGLDGWAHHYFPASITGRNLNTDIPFKEYFNQIAGEHDFVPGIPVLLSSEAFFNFRAKDMRQLQKELKGINVKIIIYLRRQDHWIQSAYNQTVKSHRHRITYSIKKYTENKHFNNLDYAQTLKQWENLFGFENIIVKVYEKQQMPQGVFQNFMDIFDIIIDNTYKIPNGAVNPSLSPFALVLLRTMNHLPMSDRIHNGLVRLLSMLPVNFANMTIFSKQSLIESNIRCQLMKRFDTSNQEIAKRYFQRDDGKLFYEKLFEE